MILDDGGDATLLVTRGSSSSDAGFVPAPRVRIPRSIALPRPLEQIVTSG